MALSQRLDLRQSQSLVMTPQLQQAIKLLQLSQMELTAFVDQELETNPLLEREDAPPGSAAAEAAAPEVVREPEDSAAAEERELWTDTSGSEGEGNLDFAGDPAAWSSMKSPRAAEEDFPGLDQTLTRPTTLRDHLLDQIHLDFPAPAERLIALYLLEL